MHCMARFWYSGLRISGLALAFDIWVAAADADDDADDALATNDEEAPVRWDGRELLAGLWW